MPALDPLVRYFQAEKAGGVILCVIGVAALVASILVWRGGWIFRAIAFPLGLVALAQIGVGAVLVARTDKQVAALKKGLAEEEATTRAKEIARVEKVNVSFRWIELAEVALLAIGVTLAVFFRSRPTVTGIGMGIMLQSSLMLVFDLVAEQRAHVYLDWLKS